MKNILTGLAIFIVAFIGSAFTTQSVSSGTYAQTGTYTSVFHYNGEQTVSVQVNKAGSGVGSANLQWSHDGQNWKNINATTYPGSSGTVAAGTQKVLLSAEVAPGNWARFIFTENGTSSGTVSGGTWIAK